MPVKEVCLGFAGKYGPYAKLVASSVLNVVALGSGALINITEAALDAANGIADNLDHKEWEQQLLGKIGQSHAEIQRLGKLLDYLAGPLAPICDQIANSADRPDELSDIVSRAIANDPSLTTTLHEIESLKSRFAVFHGDIRRFARCQEELMPVYDRMNRCIADSATSRPCILYHYSYSYTDIEYCGR